MNKLVKISSNEGGQFTASNNLVSFSFSDGVYDLSKSYVELMTRITGTGADGASNGGNGVYIPNIDILCDDLTTDEDNILPNVALVRNMSMSCANKGMISDIRRVDVLRSNLHQYEKNTNEQRSEQYLNLTSAYGQNRLKGSPWREIVKEGENMSKNLSFPVRIPLSDLCNFGKVQAYDATKYGNTKLNLELDIEKVRLSQFMGNGDAGNQWTKGDGKNAFIAPRNNVTAVTVGLPDQTTPTSIRTDVIYYNFDKMQNLQDSPFYVGQKLRFTSTGSVGGLADITNLVRMVTKIEFNRNALTAPVGGVDNSHRLTITLSSALTTALTDGQGMGALTCDGDSVVFDAFKIDSADLVLEKLGNPPDTSESIAYSEYSTEEHNANGSKNFQRLFQLEPECFNVYIMRNCGSASLADSAIGRKSSLVYDVTDYRMRVDNRDLTNRKIKVRDALSLDRLNMTLGNTDTKLHNLNERYRDAEGNNDEEIQEHYQEATKSILVMANPLYQTDREKLLQVNINSATASLNQMCVFKECYREL